MKKLHFTIIALLATSLAFAQIEVPQPSPAGSVSSKVGLTEVKIDYFRPKMNGRMIFGESDDALLKYGETWRTGANSGSKLSLSTSATIGGAEVEAGEYLILTIPGKAEWQFILYSDVKLGGNMSAYKEENAVLKVAVKPAKLANPVQTLTFNISDISENNTSANLELTWADVSIKVPIVVDFDDVIMMSIADYTKVNPKNYVAAANYYYSADKDLNQALTWINLYLADSANSKQFWNTHLKAKILAKMGKKKEAIATANESMKMAQANEGGDFGYVKRNQELIKGLK